jgi:purine/pyrimidine-nucleoside phosphorylase
MVKVNEYFDGNVKSLSFQNCAGQETVGVMKPGEYTFNTGLKEIITIVSGAMTIQFEDSDEWELFEKFQSFDVPANSSFKLKIVADTAYLCQFVG